MREKILLTICARKGSKGVKNKNIRDLCGRPLIAHSIRQALSWGKADKVICTTDSEAIAAIARQCGAEVPFMRPAHLATDSIGKLPVLQHALRETERLTGERFDVLLDLDSTAPVRTVQDIDKALKIFKQSKAKSVFSVTPCRKNPYFNMVETDARGYYRLVKKLKNPFMSRQAAPRVYDLNASIYVYSRQYLLDPKTKTPVSDRSKVLVMEEWSAFDIDHESDFQFIEFLVNKGLVKL